MTNVRYFGSQPWPFPDSLMVGFTAEHAGGELTIDDEELIDAQLVPGRRAAAHPAETVHRPPPDRRLRRAVFGELTDGSLPFGIQQGLHGAEERAGLLVGLVRRVRAVEAAKKEHVGRDGEPHAGPLGPREPLEVTGHASPDGERAHHVEGPAPTSATPSMICVHSPSRWSAVTTLGRASPGSRKLRRRLNTMPTSG